MSESTYPKGIFSGRVGTGEGPGDGEDGRRRFGVGWAVVERKDLLSKKDATSST